MLDEMIDYALSQNDESGCGPYSWYESDDKACVLERMLEIVSSFKKGDDEMDAIDRAEGKRERFNHEPRKTETSRCRFCGKEFVVAEAAICEAMEEYEGEPGGCTREDALNIIDVCNICSGEWHHEVAARLRVEVGAFPAAVDEVTSTRCADGLRVEMRVGEIRRVFYVCIEDTNEGE
jgi:hypothetical protein